MTRTLEKIFYFAKNCTFFYLNLNCTCSQLSFEIYNIYKAQVAPSTPTKGMEVIYNLVSLDILIEKKNLRNQILTTFYITNLTRFVNSVEPKNKLLFEIE